MMSSKTLANKLSDIINEFAYLLVDKPELLKTNVLESDNNIIIELFVPRSDAGKLIGKSGCVARAIRSLVIAIGARHKKIIRLTIITCE